MSTTPDKLVERYLKHLEVELDDVPRDRRREIVDEIAGHIAEARAGLEHETEADVRNILEGLGDPADIAADARERLRRRAACSSSGGVQAGLDGDRRPRPAAGRGDRPALRSAG